MANRREPRPAKTDLSLRGGWVKIVERIAANGAVNRAAVNALAADVRHRR
jgi:hypothetical protein